MPRRGNVARIEVLPDPVYNSKVLTKFINQIMLDGKKGVAESIVYGAFDIIKEKTGNDPMDVFNTAMKNVMPVLEVKASAIRMSSSALANCCLGEPSIQSTQPCQEALRRDRIHSVKVARAPEAPSISHSGMPSSGSPAAGTWISRSRKVRERWKAWGKFCFSSTSSSRRTRLPISEKAMG